MQLLNQALICMQAYRGTFLVAGGYTKGSAIEALNRDHSDAIVFGRW